MSGTSGIVATVVECLLNSFFDVGQTHIVSHPAFILIVFVRKGTVEVCLIFSGEVINYDCAVVQQNLGENVLVAVIFFTQGIVCLLVFDVAS